MLVLLSDIILSHLQVLYADLTLLVQRNDISVLTGKSHVTSYSCLLRSLEEDEGEGDSQDGGTGMESCETASRVPGLRYIGVYVCVFTCQPALLETCSG